jgi:hypothetical protein
LTQLERWEIELFGRRHSDSSFMIPTGELSSSTPFTVKSKLRHTPYALFPLQAEEAETQPVAERCSFAGQAICMDPPSLLSMWNDQGCSASILVD